MLTLNVSGLNALIKRHRIENWIKKQDLTICFLEEIRLTEKNKHWLRVKGWKNFSKQMDPTKQEYLYSHLTK
jgi:exonuclease III